MVVVANGSSIPDSVIEIIPSSRNMLSSDATPLIEISTFSSFPSIADLAGNPLPELSITANDGIAPSMQSATVISSDLIEVYFDEQVKFLNDDPSAFFPPPTFNGIPADFPTNISGNTLSIPSSTIPFPTDSALIVFIEAIIITDVAGNFFEADTILTSTADSLIPYTITETTIFIPYMMALNPSTITASDYSVTFGSNPPSAISGVSLSDDLTGVILTMQIPFGTGDTPFVEQIGSISDTFNNDVTMQGAVTQDRAPPILVSGITLGTSTSNCQLWYIYQIRVWEVPYPVLITSLLKVSDIEPICSTNGVSPVPNGICIVSMTPVKSSERLTPLIALGGFEPNVTL